MLAWNLRAVVGDYLEMECQRCREAVSARMDGERESMPAEETDRHLLACRLWQERASEVSRTVRVRAAGSTPDLSDRILAVAPAVVSTRGWWARGGLGVVAVLQLFLGLAQLMGMSPTTPHGGHEAGTLAGHPFNESTAWNLALGIGMLYTVFRPRVAAGLVPVFGGFLLVLAGYSTYDLIIGAAPASRVAGHGLLVAGVVLLVVVYRQHRDPDSRLGGVAAEPDLADEPEQGASTPAERSGPGHDGHPLRPVSRHRVA